MFTDENLQRPNVKSSTKSANKDKDEVAIKETEVSRLIIALNNYRVIMRLLFPG